MKGNEKKSHLKDKFRLVIYNDTNYEQIFTLRSKGTAGLIGVGIFVFLLVMLVTLLIAFTPLREFIPGYPNKNTRRAIVYNALKVDSLEKTVGSWERYLVNVNRILAGEDPEIVSSSNDSAYVNRPFDFAPSKEDSVFRSEVERNEQFNLSVTGEKARRGLGGILFYPPVKGQVSSSYSPKEGHYGVDIVTTPDLPVSSTLDGTVIIADWTIETGYTIQVQHDENIISIYRHNAQLLKKVGDRVRAGENIAIVGNTGEMTSGPHLHFELWYRGMPLNPELYITF